MIEAFSYSQLVAVVGPAGCGKTSLMASAAKALGLEFSLTSCGPDMPAWHLVGREGPTGPCPSAYLTSYESGGLHLLDEWDATDPGIAVSIHAPLANGHFPVPWRSAKPLALRHEQHVCGIAMNTFGFGGDRQYHGRNALDAATLDRMGGGAAVIEVGYSARIEEAISAPKDALEWVRETRESIDRNKIRRVLSTRFLAACARATRAGINWTRLRERYLASWKPDERSKVL